MVPNIHISQKKWLGIYSFNEPKVAAQKKQKHMTDRKTTVFVTLPYSMKH